jgi:type IV secretory pathway ATPase VirB11/archaellum biosynthesis ATPase
MSVCELIGAGNMDERMAAMFWIGMERGASIIVSAEPPNSGKTTTLSALLSFTLPDTLVYFTRGEGEPFALPVLADSYPTYILINELSNHIPVYTWDDNARKAFDLLNQGYRLASTMHDETVEGVLGQLGNDLSIPQNHLAHLTFVVQMYIGQVYPPIRRCLEVALVQADGRKGMKTQTVATWDMGADTFEVLASDENKAAFADWARLSEGDLDQEMEKREAIIRGWMTSGATSIPEVNNAIEAYYGEALTEPA